jgi:hypothetical protein
MIGQNIGPNLVFTTDIEGSAECVPLFNIINDILLLLSHSRLLRIILASSEALIPKEPVLIPDGLQIRSSKRI